MLTQIQHSGWLFVVNTSLDKILRPNSERVWTNGAEDYKIKTWKQ